MNGTTSKDDPVSLTPDGRRWAAYSSPVVNNILERCEKSYRAFVREASGKVPTHVLMSHIDFVHVRDAISLTQLAAGFVWMAPDGKWRLKNALIVWTDKEFMPEPVWVWTP